MLLQRSALVMQVHRAALDPLLLPSPSWLLLFIYLYYR